MMTNEQKAAMGPTANEAGNPIIVCENLVKIYKTGETEVLALQGLELTVQAGELLAIIGNSGSGKSTFLNMIGGLDKPSAGTLLVDSKDLFKMSNAELVRYKRETVGFVWQNNGRNLLPWLTAMQNVMAPMMFIEHPLPHKQQEERAKELLTLVGMEHRMHSRLSELSGGEQQRVALAIAIANHPKLLLADEPTGSVDRKTGDFILDVFRKLNEQGMTIVIVTHDRLLSKKVSRVVSIRDGKTSSEFIMKQDYRNQLENIGLFDTTQEEFAVLDRAGRVQLPREMLDELHLTGNKVRMELQDGKIIITAP